MKYRVELSQIGYGRLSAVVEVEADNKEQAIEEVCEGYPIEWKVNKFSGEGYDVDSVTEIE